MEGVTPVSRSTSDEGGFGPRKDPRRTAPSNPNPPVDRPATHRAGRARLAAAGVGATLIALLCTAGCSTGQIAETAQETSAVAGVNAQVGSIDLRDVGIAAPQNGLYRAGENAPLTFTLVNNGGSADTLTSISTDAASSVAISGGGITVGPNQAVPVGNRPGDTGSHSSQTVTLHALTGEFRPGQSVTVTFLLKNAGKITFAVAVDAPITAVPQPSGTPPPPTSE